MNQIYGTLKQNRTLLPGKDFIFQTTASLSGAYEADPIDVRMLGFVASEGTGNSMKTFVALLYQKRSFQ